MKVLVTGGAGYIGSWVAGMLRRRGSQVVIFDDFANADRRGIEELLSDPDVSIIEGDVRDRAAVDQACSDADATVHLAGISDPVQAADNPEFVWAVNVSGTLNMLQAARWNSHSRFVYASDASVYGPRPRLPAREDGFVTPSGLVGASKIAGEALVAAFGSAYSLSAASLRIFDVYGPRRGGRRQWEVGGLRRVVKPSDRSTEPAFGGLDLVYVEDVAEAIVTALECKVTGPVNIGTGRTATVPLIARSVGGNAALRKALGSARVMAEPRPARASTAKSAKALGWRAENHTRGRAPDVG